jgi:hypothetical protein
VDLLSDLIHRELASPKPSDAVVFLGPASGDFADAILQLERAAATSRSSSPNE